MFLAMARAASQRSTCFRLNVGAVIVSSLSHNVLAVGYNGAPSGQPHCTGNGCQYFTPRGCKVVHAEANALSRLTTSAYCHVYTTHSPCSDCVELLLSQGRIEAVYFETAYRDPTPIARLIDGGIQVYQVLPSGLMVDQKTGDLVQ